MATTDCFDCGETISADDIEAFENLFLAHIREAHPALPYPDNAVRNFAAATQRISDATDRLDDIGAVEVHPVDSERVDDWLELFDHTGFAGNPAWASCYCTEPHVVAPDGSSEELGDDARWHDRRTAMLAMLDKGTTFGYLAYVDSTVAGWINASLRSSYRLYGPVGADAPPADRTVGVSCFVIAPPYRRHGLAGALLDRVIADAPRRGATHVVAYPFNEREESPMVSAEAGEFRGPRAMFDARGFAEVEVRDRDTLVRLALA